MRSTLIGLALVLILALRATPASAQPANQKVADEIIAMVKASWAAEAAKKAPESMKFFADDYTEFNSDVATRLEGKALVMRLGEAAMKEPGKMLASEMVNEKVQIYGDTAILTYNFIGLSQDKDGKITPVRAKSTRVFVKLNGKWMMVHANFAADPLPK